MDWFDLGGGKHQFKVTAGNTVITAASGNFTIPAYNTLTVVCEGAQGARGADGASILNNANDPVPGGTGGQGGAGGKATKTWNAYNGPVVGSSISYNNTTATSFNYGTVPTGNQGGAGSPGTDAYYQTSGGDTSYYSGDNGSPGTPGTATGGDTNVTGGSIMGTTNGRITITWS